MYFPDHSAFSEQEAMRKYHEVFTYGVGQSVAKDICIDGEALCMADGNMTYAIEMKKHDYWDDDSTSLTLSHLRRNDSTIAYIR